MPVFWFVRVGLSFGFEVFIEVLEKEWKYNMTSEVLNILT